MNIMINILQISLKTQQRLRWEVFDKDEKTPETQALNQYTMLR